MYSAMHVCFLMSPNDQSIKRCMLCVFFINFILFQETYQSFHYTTLLYLGDYNIDFKGGRFVFVDNKFNSTVEPRKSRLSMFTSGHENLHYVEKVISGTRYAMTISFTCDKQHAIEDPNTNKYEIN